MTPISLETFEACTIPREEYTHRAHLTVAYLYLRAHPLVEATDRMRTGIHRFNASKGIVSTPTGGYHETITVAWMKLLHSTMKRYGDEGNAEQFFAQHSHFLTTTLLRVFYSREVILSLRARQEWVEPDLAGLPE